MHSSKQIRFKVRFLLEFPRWTSGKHDWYCHLAVESHRLNGIFVESYVFLSVGENNKLSCWRLLGPSVFLLSEHKLCGWWVGGEQEITIRKWRFHPHRPSRSSKIFHSIFSVVFLLFLCGNEMKNKLIKKILRFGEARMNVLCFG